MRFIIAIILIPFISYSQETIGYLVTKSGDSTQLYKNKQEKIVTVKSQRFLKDYDTLYETLYFFDASNTVCSIPMSQVLITCIGEAKYINLPYKSSILRGRHEVIAENDQYVLANFFNEYYYLSVYDKTNLKLIEKKVKHSVSKTEDEQIITNKIQPYFPSCNQLIEPIKKSIQTLDYKPAYFKEINTYVQKNILFKDMTNISCGDVD